MTRLLLLALLFQSLLGACQMRSCRLDPNAQPVTEGDWYRPKVSATWQWQLKEELNSDYDVEVYDIDLFDSSKQTIADLKDDGRKVICYFSAGSSEDWRDDFEEFDTAVLGEELDGWEGERWLDIRSDNVLDIMLERLDLAEDKGCHGVEPDNMDGYTNDSGFDLTAEDQLAYNKFIANEAHHRDLTVGLKNDGGQADGLVDFYDFSLNEQCHEFEECAELEVFVENDKPIFNAEYTETEQEAEDMSDDICGDALDEKIRTLILPLALDDSFRVSCDN